MVRMAFIGCGGIARQHIEVARSLAGLTIVGYCDTDPRALDAARALAPAPTFAGWDDLLMETRPEAVVVAVPHSLHSAALTAALEANAHVLCEKPLAPTVSEARHVVDLARSRGRLLGIRYQCRADGAWQWLRRHVAEGVFGPVYYIQALLWQNWLGEGWRGDPALALGGELNDAGSHLIDAMLWSTAVQPRVIAAMTENRDLLVDRLASISFRFDGGLGSVSIVGETVEPGYDSRLDVWCRDAHVSLHGFSNGVITVNGHSVPARDMPGLPEEGVANFVRAIRGEVALQAEPESGILVAAFTAGAYESVREGRAITL